MRILKSWLYNTIAIKDGERTVVITPATITVIEGGRVKIFDVVKGERWGEEDEKSNTAVFIFIPEPGATPEGYVRELKDGRLIVKMGAVTIEVGEVHEI